MKIWNNKRDNKSTSTVTTGVATEEHQRHINNKNKRNIKENIKEKEINNSFCSELEAQEPNEEPQTI